LNPSAFGDIRGQPVEVVEGGGEADEGDYGGDFVQEEEG